MAETASDARAALLAKRLPVSSSSLNSSLIRRYPARTIGGKAVTYNQHEVSKELGTRLTSEDYYEPKLPANGDSEDGTRHNIDDVDTNQHKVEAH
jgi:hypothetical protein